MTAQTPAPKASSAEALLASLPTNPPQTPAPPQQDFLTVISLALAPKTIASSSTPPTAPGPGIPVRQKPSLTGETEAAASSLLLALLTPLPPPLPLLANPTPQKASVPSVPSVPSAPSQATSALDSNAISLAKSWTVADSKSPAPAVKALPVQLEAVAPAAQPDQKPPVKSDTLAATEKLACPVAAPDGTSVALSSPKMSFSVQRNENAGSTEQKLPPGSISAVAAVAGGGSSSQGGAKSSLHFSWRQAPSEELAVIDFSAKAAAPALSATDVPATTPANSASTAQVDRLERLISREVVSIRQTGAESLGVLLTVDSKTQLFLQLTNHNGQVQASLRCERGDFSALDPQWAQLQQSLARQNVQLATPSGSSTASGFQPPPDQSQRQPASPREDWPPTGPVVPPAQQRQQKNPNRSRRSWESWA